MDRHPDGAPKNSRVFSGVLAVLVTAVLAFLSGAPLIGDPFSQGLSTAALLLLTSALFSVLSAAVVCFVNLSFRSVLWAIAPVAGFSVAAALGFSVSMVPSFVLCIAASELFCHLVLKKTARIPSVTAVTVLVGLSILATLLLYARESLGTLDFGELLSFLQTRVTDFCARSVELFRASVPAEQAALLSADLETVLTSSLVLSLPGLFLSAIFFCAYTASFVLRLLMKKSGALAILYEDGFYPTPTVFTAILYAVCFLVTSLLADLVSVEVFATFSNLETVLQLLFAFVGVSWLCRSRKTRFVARPNYLLYASIGVAALVYFASNLSSGFGLLLMALLGILSIGLPILSFFGLFYTIIRCVRERKKKPSDDEKGM